MRRKTAVLLIAALIVSGVLAGCGKEKGGADVSLKEVKTNKKLTVGLDPAFPPMGFMDADQEIVGFDIDVAREVCGRMGVEPEFKPIDWETKEQELNTKGIDCIWNGFSKSPSREKELLLSEKYMLNTQVAVVPAESGVQTLKDLAGKKAAVQTTSTAEEAIDADQAFKDSLGELISVKDNVQAMLELGTNGADAVIMDKVVAMYYMSQADGKYRVLEDSLADEEYVIGFRKNDRALCAEIEKCLKEMKNDGTLEKISSKWFGEDITTIQ